MKKKVRIVSVILTLALILGLFAGCGKTGGNQSGGGGSSGGDQQGDYPIPELASQYPEFAKHHEITIGLFDVYGIPDNDMNLIGKELEKRTNLKIVWDRFGTGMDEIQSKLNIMVASGDMPFDIVNLPGTAPEHSAAKQLGMMGKAWDIRPLVKDYENLNNLLEPFLDYYKDTENDANWFYLGSLETPVPGYKPDGFYGLYWVRQDFVEQLGMPYPETPEELYTYLKRCKDEIQTFNGQPIIGLVVDEGFGGLYDGALGIDWGLTRMFYPYVSEQYYAHGLIWPSAFGIDIQDNYKIHNFMFDDSEVLMNAAKFLGMLYREGLIDQDISTIRHSQFAEKASTGVAAGIVGCWDPDTYRTNLKSIDPNATYVYPPMNFDKKNGCLKDPDFKWTSAISAGQIHILSKSMDEETVRHFLAVCDYLTTVEGQKLIWYGVEGETYEYDEEGKLALLPDFAAKDWDGRVKEGWLIGDLMRNRGMITDLEEDVTKSWNPEQVKDWENNKWLMDRLDINMTRDLSYYLTLGPEEISRTPALGQAKIDMWVKVFQAKSDEEIEQIVHDYGKICRDLGADIVLAEKQSMMDALVAGAR